MLLGDFGLDLNKFTTKGAVDRFNKPTGVSHWRADGMALSALHVPACLDGVWGCRGVIQ